MRGYSIQSTVCSPRKHSLSSVYVSAIAFVSKSFDRYIIECVLVAVKVEKGHRRFEIVFKTCNSSTFGDLLHTLLLFG